MPLFIKVGSIRESRSSLSHSPTLMLLLESGAFSTIRTRRGQSAPSIAIGPAGQLPECRLRPIGRTRRSRSRKPLVFLNLIAAGRPRRTELQVHILVFGYIAVEANPAGESSLRRRADLSRKPPTTPHRLNSILWFFVRKSLRAVGALA